MYICGLQSESLTSVLVAQEDGTKKQQRRSTSMSTPLAVESSNDEFLRSGVHCRAIESIVSFPGIQEAKPVKSSFQVVQSPPDIQLWKGRGLSRIYLSTSMCLLSCAPGQKLPASYSAA